jgi:hypothetical protein
MQGLKALEDARAVAVRRGMSAKTLVDNLVSSSKTDE